MPHLVPEEGGTANVQLVQLAAAPGAPLHPRYPEVQDGSPEVVDVRGVHLQNGQAGEEPAKGLKTA